MAPWMSSTEDRPEHWDDVESELSSANREASSWHLAWPTTSAMAAFRQEVESRWSGNVRLPLP
jgi:hypothetical protein